ncbi:MAG: response regulator [Bacteroidota bacterium]
MEQIRTPGHGTSVLIVEDELIIAEDLRRRLTSLGFNVTGIATTGEDAVSRVEESGPDLVLMDISLRGEMDGVEAAKLIRERTGTPIVYVTGHGDPETMQRAKSTPGFAFVLKPVDDREMQYIFEMVLNRPPYIDPAQDDDTGGSQGVG